MYRSITVSSLTTSTADVKSIGTFFKNELRDLIKYAQCNAAVETELNNAADTAEAIETKFT